MSPAASSRTTTGITELLGRRTASGGFRPRPDSPAEFETNEATAWATVALSICEPHLDEDASAASRALARAQGPDGRLSTHALHPGAYSPTSLAVLAWTGDAQQAEPRRRAVEFLLSHQGNTYEQPAQGAIRVDTEIAGWPWVDRTFSWAEPTALALLALASAGFADHARAREGARMLLDRQIESGGWNYGNTRVFDAELLHAPESTGLVLTALAGRVSRAEVERSLARLAQDLPRLRTPLALGWSLLAAAAWELDTGGRERAIDETLARAPRYGGYETAELALLLVADAAPKGLLAALAVRGGESR